MLVRIDYQNPSPLVNYHKGLPGGLVLQKPLCNIHWSVSSQIIAISKKSHTFWYFINPQTVYFWRHNNVGVLEKCGDLASVSTVTGHKFNLVPSHVYSYWERSCSLYIEYFQAFYDLLSIQGSSEFEAWGKSTRSLLMVFSINNLVFVNNHSSVANQLSQTVWPTPHQISESDQGVDRLRKIIAVVGRGVIEVFHHLVRSAPSSFNSKS